MYIAQQLKEKNIAEYLLYMWQVEDILRAHHLDPDELKQNYLAQFRATEETEKEMEEWYSHLIRMMKEEGIQEGGHLQINRNIICGSPTCTTNCCSPPSFRSTRLLITSLTLHRRTPQQGRQKGRVGIGKLFRCPLRRDVAPPATQTDKRRDRQAVADITKLLAMLSDYYKQDKAGELKFE